MRASVPVALAAAFHLAGRKQRGGGLVGTDSLGSESVPWRLEQVGAWQLPRARMVFYYTYTGGPACGLHHGEGYKGNCLGALEFDAP